MRKLLCLLLLLTVAPVAFAAGGKLMHCFYYTPMASATEADWQAFHKATEELPKKIPGLLTVWYGKLRAPFRQIAANPEAAKKANAGEKDVPATINVRVRQYGVCMEFADEAALKAYAPHPAHKEWEAVYGKVREPGTATFDIIVP
jgi:hypothetical protein